MKKNIFNLERSQLKEIATSFLKKIEEGLSKQNSEIQCIPTYIEPKSSIDNGKALVLDLGGTNYRAAIVEFTDGYPSIRPQDGWKKKLDVMKEEDFTQEKLLNEQADLICEIDHTLKLPIGYCFSYPAESLLNGDARLIRWTKGIHIKEMIGQPIGKTLLDFLNKQGIAIFTSIKVINDTVASLFAGLAYKNYDAYIGLIVGTGTNMATFIPREHIPKLDKNYEGKGFVPVNLESGNFTPPYLTEVDAMVDELSDSKGRQLFEKAVSGLYLGEIFKAVFPDYNPMEEFNARDLNQMVNNPDLYRCEYVDVANWIFKRSAQLVASSLAGLILVIHKCNPAAQKIYLTAEGSVFWSKIENGKHYSRMVLEELHGLLEEFDLSHIKIDVEEKKNINLIGTAIAALS